MEKQIAYCGLGCHECPAFIATLHDDDRARAETAKLWSEMYQADIKPEHINCDGCTADSERKIMHCSQCEIRSCAVEKNVENCAYCEEFACEQLTQFFGFAPDAKIKLMNIHESLQNNPPDVKSV